MGMALTLVVLIALVLAGFFGFLFGVIYLSAVVEQWFKTQWARMTTRRRE